MKRFLVLMMVAVVFAGCDADQHIALVKKSMLHPEGCGKHGAAIASVTMEYTFRQPDFLADPDVKIGTLVTCHDGVTVLVP